MSKNVPFGPSLVQPRQTDCKVPGGSISTPPTGHPRESFRAHYQRRVPTLITGLDMAKQEFKDEADINHIVKNFVKTNAINHFAKYSPQYGDFSPCDFQEAQNLVNRATQMFADLPFNIRELTQTPDGFLAFVQDPANHDRMVELGLVRTEPDPIAGSALPATEGGA